MALTHSVAVRNARCNDIITRITTGTTNATGAIVFMTSADVTVATLNMNATPYGAPVNGTMTANTGSADTNAVGGTIALYKVVDRDGTEVYRGTVTVTGGGGDLELTSLAINPGDTVNLNWGSVTYTAAP